MEKRIAYLTSEGVTNYHLSGGPGTWKSPPLSYYIENRWTTTSNHKQNLLIKVQGSRKPRYVYCREDAVVPLDGWVVTFCVQFVTKLCQPWLQLEVYRSWSMKLFSIWLLQDHANDTMNATVDSMSTPCDFSSISHRASCERGAAGNMMTMCNWRMHDGMRVSSFFHLLLPFQFCSHSFFCRFKNKKWNQQQKGSLIHHHQSRGCWRFVFGIDDDLPEDFEDRIILVHTTHEFATLRECRAKQNFIHVSTTRPSLAQSSKLSFGPMIISK